MKRCVSAVIAAALIATAMIPTPSFALLPPPIIVPPPIIPPPPSQPSPPSSAPKQQQPASRHHSGAGGQIAIGCGIGAAGGLMIGSAVSNGDRDHPRQMTVTEAAWAAGLGCPVFLPLALLAQTMCPDNDATYTIATYAHKYAKANRDGVDYTPFTSAYGYACKTGRLSPEFKDFLKANGLLLVVPRRSYISVKG
jgi:hypothetical protein